MMKTLEKGLKPNENSIYEKLNMKQARKKMKTYKIEASAETYRCTFNLKKHFPFLRFQHPLIIRNAIYMFIRLWYIPLIIL